MLAIVGSLNVSIKVNTTYRQPSRRRVHEAASRIAGYVREIQDLGDEELVAAAEAALWDLILERQKQKTGQLSRPELQPRNGKGPAV